MRFKYVNIAAVSCIMLLLQLTFTRILSFIYWNHLVYLIVSIVLLGYGIGSIFIIITRSWLEKFEFNRVQGFLLLCFSASVPLSLIIAGNAIIPMHGTRLSLWKLAFPLLINYLFFILPFFFLGAFIVYYFFNWPKKSGHLYLFDLGGAALGCVLFPFCLKKFGAPGLALLAASAAWAISFMLIWGHNLNLKIRRNFSIKDCVPKLCSIFTIIFISAAFIFQDGLINIRPVSTKILAKAYSHPGARIEYTRWDVGARIDIAGADDSQAITGKGFPIPNLPHKVLTNDGDAYTAIVDSKFYSLRSPCEKVFRFLQSSPYLLYPAENVLIIGVGGGPDIIKALACKAGQITGVEVAGATIEAMEGPFAEYSGGIYLQPNVKVHHDEGRSFLRRSQQKYNVIQMSGVDTFSALASGAYVLAENYLYTVDAMKDFIGHLETDGFLIIRRWYFAGQPRESLRLFVLAFHALKEMGVEDPAGHIIVSGKFMWATAIVKKTPYTQRELEAFREENSRVPELETIFMPGSDYCNDKKKNFFNGYACAFSSGMEEKFLDDYYFDISPVYDNNPFFFKYYKTKNMFDVDKSRPEWRQGSWAYWILMLILAQSCVLVAAFIFLPLFLFKKKGLELPGSPLLILYFTCLGLGFIIIEIALMQQLTLFLGLPIYSIAVVLSGLLMSAGMGSFVSERFNENPATPLGIITALLVLILISTNYGLPILIHRYLGAHLFIRIALTVAAIFPTGFLLGFYFPMGLVISSKTDESLVPWAWGINAGFTVIGSIVSIIAAMAVGFRGVIWMALAIYLMAYLSMRLFLSGSEEKARD